MTEQPPSAEALNLVGRLRKPLHAPDTYWHELNLLDAGKAIDALIAQRVSAETERCAKIAQEATDYVSAGKPLVVIPARTFASDLALDIRDAIRAQGKQT